ncbi:MAG: phytoene/squalene synthase family protein [Bryobacteraceae bacterium]
MTLEASYAHCREVARSRARNFYYSFLLLPERKRLAMCAVYAFMRECDDRSDGPGASPEKVEQWRGDLASALAGREPAHPVWPAFIDTVRRYRIPETYFQAMIDGVASDFEPRTISTFDDLYSYCYRVASVVGLTIIHIFGFEDPRALELAEKCGIAFQLTNILRDVREDAAAGRVYLPAEDFERFGVRAGEMNQPQLSAPLRALLEFELGRAREYYNASRPLLELVQRDSRPALWALIEIYRRLLDRIEAQGYPVLERRVSLPAREKIAIVVRAWSGLC